MADKPAASLLNSPDDENNASGIERAATRSRFQYGLGSLLRDNKTIPLALVGGTVACLLAFGFTLWLSRQTVRCPEWAINCTVNNYISKRAGLIQGIATLVFSLGQASIASAVYAVSETLFWIIISKEGRTLDHNDTCLSTTGGSMVSSMMLLLSFISKPDLDTFILVTCVTLSVLSTASSTVTVGFVLNRVNIIEVYASKHPYGGGTGLVWHQDYPSRALPYDIAKAYVQYTSWANGVSPEPLADYRDFLVDRQDLADKGNMNIRAIRAVKEIHCTGTPLNLSINKERLIEARVGSHMTYGLLRPQPRLTLWADTFETRYTKNTTSADVTIIFAMLNGNIEGGVRTQIKEKLSPIEYISAVACSIFVDLEDAELRIGNNKKLQWSTVSNMDSLVFPARNGSVSFISQWLAVATTVMGGDVERAQPMYYMGETGLPVAHVGGNIVGNFSEDWTQASIINFINVTAGAVLGSFTSTFSGNSRSGQKNVSEFVDIESEHTTIGYERSRPFLLLLPMIITLTCWMILILYSYHAHQRAKVPVMRRARYQELASASRSGNLREAV